MICKIKSLLVLFALLVGATSLWSQSLTTDQDPVLIPGQLLDSDLVGEGNTSYLDQVGSDNFAEINQRQRGQAKINLVNVLQAGDFNEAYIYQNGSGNQTALIQRGSDNFYQLNVDGVDNQFVVIQEGDANSVIQELSRSSDANIELIQLGNNNEIIQILDSANGMEFQLIQNGDGMRTIIDQTPQ